MKKNFLFLGFAIPDEEMEKVFKQDQFPGIQTHKFNWDFIKGIERYDDLDYTYISARPVSDYPLFPKKLVGGKSWEVNLNEKKTSITEIPFINTSILKIITRFLSAVYYSFKKYHKIKNKGGVIVYSVHVPFMLVGYILARIYKISYIAIWTDPPSVNKEKESFLKSKLRRMELYVSKYLMNKATKVIALTKYLAEDFAPGKPYLVVEGIIDERDINTNTVSSKIDDFEHIKIVYTGSLEKKYGIKNIVDGFILMNNENVVLEIYGRGDYEDDLKEACENNEHIQYKGFVANKEILKIQRNADFLINARSAHDYYVKYSFPSKTLEYMLSGTPLITTMLPGIPEEYRKYVLVLENNEPKEICNMLKKAVNLDQLERYKLGMSALEFARNKNYINQGKRITRFLNNYEEGKV